jgi:hypothetical protein
VSSGYQIITGGGTPGEYYAGTGFGLEGKSGEHHR